MKRLLMILIALFIAHRAQAADISLVLAETSEHPAVILIQGLFEMHGYSYDANNFSKITASLNSHQKNVVVFLDSPGGNTVTAMWIGERVRDQRLATAVADDAKCASACALIWIAGNERYMGARARIGFHSARATWDKNSPKYNQPHVTGNAVIAKYLQNLGLKEREGVRLISAPPTSMTWVTPSALATYGVEASYLSTSDKKWSWDAQTQVTWPIRRRIIKGLDPLDLPNPTERLFQQAGRKT